MSASLDSRAHRPRLRVQTYPVSTDFLPLHSLPRDRQLPPQTLKAALSQIHKRPIQLFLESILHLGNLPHSRLSAARGTHLHLLARAHPHIAIFVVMHIYLDRTAERTRGGVEDVRRAPAAVPEVLRRVLVGDKEDCDAAVGVDRVDAYG